MNGITKAVITSIVAFALIMAAIVSAGAIAGNKACPVQGSTNLANGTIVALNSHGDASLPYNGGTGAICVQGSWQAYNG